MTYKPIEVDRENLTIMGVRFPDLDSLNSAANAIGSNMFEGFEPTPKSIEIIRDYLFDKITIEQLIQLTKEKAYAY
jgi:putative transcriptional regulator